MNKNRITIASLVMAMLILGTVFVPVVSAKNAATYTSATASEEQLEIVRKLWGTDITNGEYIKQVFPEAYNKSPNDATKAYYEMKMIWVDPMNDSEQNFESAVIDTKGLQIYLVEAQGSVTKSSPTKISFSAYEKMLLPSSTTPIPQMALTTQVFRKNGDNAVLVGASCKTGQNVYKITTSGATSYAAGDYKIITQASAVWPPGVEPPTWYGVRDSGWKHL